MQENESPGGAPTFAGGLTSEEAERRLALAGPNTPAPRKNHSALSQLLGLFLNPLVLILLIAAIATAFLGETVNAIIIATIVVLGVAINFFQTYQSQRAVERLRERVTPTATVLRDGSWREISRQEVVPGDWIRLSAGDLVPADARLIESRDLFVQQSALTGESVPAEKEAAGAEASEDPASPESRGRVFLGTSVVSGIATAEVTATGTQTVFGGIARRLAARPPETEFERGIRQFSGLILRTVFFLVLFILLVSVILERDPLQSLLFAVALAVGLTPEFLPMITSVTLARGAVRMAREDVIVKQLAAIQNFGSIGVLCSDKTGTITTGEMILEQALDPLGAVSERPLQLAWLNSRFETGIRSPLDTAILKHTFTAGENYEKYDEIPFDFERRRLSVVVAERARSVVLLITKGAPEGIFALCRDYEAGGQILALNAAETERLHQAFERLSAHGLRVLGVAYRNVEPRSRYAASDERDLTFAGYLTFADPPVPEAADAVRDLKRDGVQIKIVTGDSDAVTRHVCELVGLDGSDIVLGDEIAEMNDTALAHVVENANVFARVSPAQKTRILLALKHRSHVVGFMGDGINDAPSLHTADVGISVSSAVDVARDAAQIILVRPGLQILHRGIIEGRKAFGNVTKYLLMGTSSNFGNMFSMAAASVFLPFLPMLPQQILLNNFLYDLAQITIPGDNVDEEYIRHPQRWNIGLIRNFMVLIGPISSIYDFLTFFVLLRVLHASEPLFHTGWFVESLATQTLVLFVIRTRLRPWESRPSPALTATTLGVVAAGIAIPYTPIAGPLGFTPLPAWFFAFLAPATATYLMLVEIAKRKLFPPQPMRP
jgi:Mg2+-importing ATPase